MGSSLESVTETDFLTGSNTTTNNQPTKPTPHIAIEPSQKGQPTDPLHPDREIRSPDQTTAIMADVEVSFLRLPLPRPTSIFKGPTTADERQDHAYIKTATTTTNDDHPSRFPSINKTTNQ